MELVLRDNSPLKDDPRAATEHGFEQITHALAAKQARLAYFNNIEWFQLDIRGLALSNGVVIVFQIILARLSFFLSIDVDLALCHSLWSTRHGDCASEGKMISNYEFARIHDRTGNVNGVAFSNSNDVAWPNEGIGLFLTGFQIINFEDSDPKISLFRQARILEDAGLRTQKRL